MLPFAAALCCFALAIRRTLKAGMSPVAAMLLYYSLGYVIYTYAVWFSVTKRDVNVGFFIADIPLSTTYTATPLMELQNDATTAHLLFAIIFAALWFIPANKPVPAELPNLSRFKIPRPAQKMDVFGILMAVSVIFVLLELWHAANVPWHDLWWFARYQTYKHPDGLGITNPLLRMFHFQMKVSGLVLFGLAIYAADHKKYGLLLVAFLASLYPLFFNMITNSRFIISYPALFILLGLVQRKPAKVAVGVFGFLYFFNLSITGRSRGEYGISTYTFEYLWNVFLGIPNAVVGVVVNVFDTMFIIGRAAFRGGAYSPTYEMLSFSPLPSSIDKFESIREEGMRISRAVPYSSWIEAYLFGWSYFALLLVAVIAMVVLAQRLHERVGTRIGIVIVAWTLVVNQLISQYPVRNSFRFVLLSLIIFGFALRSAKPRKPQGSGLVGMLSQQAQARMPAPFAQRPLQQPRPVRAMDRPRTMSMRR